MEIRAALAAGLPAYAECGGLMYLTRRIQWRGRSAEMAGVIAADTIVGERPQGRGYMLIEETGNHPWPQPANSGKQNPVAIPVHEFHYARLDKLADNPVFTQRVLRGTGIDGYHDGLVVNNLLAGFAHHRHTATNCWVERFVAFVRNQRSNH